LVYFLFQCWFLSHSLLKFLEQAESAEGDVQCGKGEETRRVLYTCCSAAQLDRRNSGKSRVRAFFIIATSKIVPQRL
jgi:hypothetical protein